ncbi:F0F1 ATP synthase subunit delta [Thiomonas sp. FB-6]|uniref:F0F1 ATP synthase subunit delta n=1 Tax=Thiomonas sp. FB-6 TaxID=1158291 RepID=UPI0003757252|nr:F0F1 ATP synthase subunit delta [Thiomonas sp. FB-6]
MPIDWFTVGAQALNFAILVWLMKRFLYQPILDAIDAREARIAAELADAASRRAEAAQERAEIRHKNDVFDQQRAALLSRATEEANAERQRLLEAARQAAAEFTSRREEALRTEAGNLNQTIVRRAQDEVFAIARQALKDLADTALEQRMCDEFTRRLRALEGDTRESLARALGAAAGPASLRSAFDLPAPQRAAIEAAVHDTFGPDIALRFETAPDLVGGIELRANGQKVAWSIADYLSSLQRGVGELLKAQSLPEPPPGRATGGDLP